MHRDGDKPAYVSTEKRIWYSLGRVHRDGDKPAWIDEEFGLAWLKNGYIHRENNKPAILDVSGEATWRINGRFVSNRILTHFEQHTSLRFAFVLCVLSPTF